MRSWDKEKISYYFPTTSRKAMQTAQSKCAFSKFICEASRPYIEKHKVLSAVQQGDGR
jgi:hypothetical protein